MQLRKAIVPALVLLAAATFAFGQAAQGSTSSSSSGPVVILSYFDDQSQISVTNSQGAAYQFVNFGMTLGPGDKVVTQNTSAELQLSPNGTIIKLAPNTQFSIDSIQGVASASTNSFSLLGGQLRTIAAKVAGASYQFRTNTAVGGVRGTDFGMEVVPGQSDSLFVKEGSVAFTKTATGQTLTLNAGDFANALASTFQAIKLSQQQLDSLFNPLSFKQLNPQDVPGHQAETQQASNQTPAPTNPAPAVPPTPSTQSTAPGPASTKPGPLDGVMNFLAKYLGMQIGSVTIDGQTYSDLTLQPQFTLGKLKAALYLPIIYSTNLFDPQNSWYHPAGNNEWSFGFDQKDILSGVEDFASDLFLKIRYIEYGQQRDPFYLKVGNLHDMTLGHGVIVNNFANDSDFPAVRRVGVNLGLDGKVVGLEAMVNDLANPQIFGTRLYFRPFAKSFPLAFGFTGVTDINPASPLPDPSTLPAGTPNANAIQAAETAQPIFINVGTDLDLPIINTDPFSIIAFGDVAGLLPYLRNSVSLNGVSIASGVKVNALIDTSGGFPLRNYGIESGLMGTLFGLNYRLEYRNYNGIFRPTFYDSSYERLRGSYATDLMQYLADPTAAQYDHVTMGIYGEASFTLLKAISFDAGYLWPWTWDSSGNIAFGTDDYLKLQLGVAKGLIPLGISLNIAYERTKFVPTIISGTAVQLFDANTILSGSIVYPIAPTMNIVLAVSTAAVHNQTTGAIEYGSDGNPVIAPSISVETQIGY